MTKEEQFDAFWAAYPRRISKGAARTAFAKAIKKTTLEVMLEALKAYRLHKPEKIDFKHPATWLNGECWDDEWEQKSPLASFGGRYQTREEYLAAEQRRANRSFQH
jgi:hypothetical protein